MKHNQLKLIGGSLKGLAIPTADRAEVPAEANLLKVRGGILVLSKNGASGLEWQQAVDTRDVLYDFATHTFTNAGKTGTTGPTLAQCKTAYAAASQWINNAAWFGVTATGIQEWTVPVTGYYRIRARGASRYFGLSATVSDTRPEADAVFRLLKGDKLRIAVGQLGYYPPNVGPCVSGSGGTFVQSAEQGLLLVGGGAGGYAGASSIVGVTTRLAGPSIHISSNVLIPPQSAEGKAGINRTYSNGNQSSQGYGGASYDDQFTDGRAPKSFLNGATGGTNIDRVSTHAGGFGGGGAGGVNYNSSYNTTCVGGGGGYSGGDGAGMSNTGARGGDGGCFIADFGTDQDFIMTPTNSPQHGRVIVDLVG